MIFARPDLLWLAAALPALVAAGLWAWARRRRRAARALGSAALVARLGAGDLERFPASRLALLVVAAAALGVAAAGPHWGLETVEEPAVSARIVMAMDVSRSMLARDVAPDRLERQRVLGRRILQEFPGDRIGLVAFAGSAHILSPMTVDHAALHLYLDALDPDIVSHGGSSLAAAIRQAADLARGPEDGARGVVVLVSDGEALEARESVVRAAERAARVGVTIHTVGIGTVEGGPIPVADADGSTGGFMRGPDGQVVITRLDDQLLRDVARITGGRHVRLGDAGATDAVVRALRGLDRVRTEATSRVRPIPRHAWFVLVAALLLALDGWLEARRARPRPRTRLAGTAAVLLLLVLTTGAAVGGIERGNRLYRAGQYAEAVEVYRGLLGTRDDSPRLRYNLGTALLRLGAYEEAEEHLRAALDGIPHEARPRVRYNLGQRFLEEARAATDPAAARALYDAAADAYREALRLDPGDRDAKWNYELSLRERESLPPVAGADGPPDPAGSEPDPEPGPGGQGAGEAGAPGGSPDRSPATGGAHDPMSLADAERILNAIEQDERELIQSRLSSGQPRSRVERDW